MHKKHFILLILGILVSGGIFWAGHKFGDRVGNEIAPEAMGAVLSSSVTMPASVIVNYNDGTCVIITRTDSGTVYRTMGTWDPITKTCTPATSIQSTYGDVISGFSSGPIFDHGIEWSSSRAIVAYVQTRLINQKLLARAPVWGTLDTSTVSAIKKFQKSKNLKETGLLDLPTRTAFNALTQTKQ